MHTVFALLCFVVVIHWLIFPYPPGLLHWHCGNLTIAPVPVKQPWWIWINTSCEFIMNDYITTTKQSTTKPCAYFLGYTVCHVITHPYLNFNIALVKPPDGGLVKLPLKLMHWWVNITYMICMLITYPSPNFSKSMLAKWILNTAIPFKFTFALDNSFAASRH